MRPNAVFRMGGNEFALLLEDCPRHRALEVVDRVLVVRGRAADGDWAVAASFGVAVTDCSAAIDSDELLRRADDAMYDEGLALGPQHRRVTPPAPALALRPAGR